jgi:hypothetical protein
MRTHGVGASRIAGTLPLLILTSLVFNRAAAGQPQPRQEILAQRIVRELVDRHRDEVAAMEIALLSTAGCATIAATDPKDIGERCDADELGPIRTGTPNIEAPTADDPVFDITQALHDKSGRLVGAVGMDIKPPAGGEREIALARAKALLAELEALIPSAAELRKR